MALPVVAIVGRPNVGKSSLLNALAKRRISIVDPTAGVTRDRVSTVVDHRDTWFELIDTGGYGIDDKDNLTADIERQIALAVESATVVLFVVDIREEITPLDRDVAKLLRTQHDRVILIANKADSQKDEPAAGVFARLGYGDARIVSALHGYGVGALLDEVVKRLDTAPGAPPEPVMKVAIIGRQNVGKSTFVNALAGEPRVIVSEIPGTTRDAIDVRFERDGKTFVVIDTAGVRKQRHIATHDLEFYSHVRAQSAIHRADVVLLLIDATQNVVEVDKRLATMTQEEFKPIIIVVNKWDLAKGRAGTSAYGDYLAKTLSHLRSAPIAFTTASNAKNVSAVIDLAMTLFKQARQRVETGKLNRLLKEVLAANPPQAVHGRPPKIYYASQVSVAPPTIVLACNRAATVREDYKRFLEKRLADALPFQEVPLRLLWRERESSPRAAARQAPDKSPRGGTRAQKKLRRRSPNRNRAD